jgi:hypothetical protein
MHDDIDRAVTAFRKVFFDGLPVLLMLTCLGRLGPGLLRLVR